MCCNTIREVELNCWVIYVFYIIIIYTIKLVDITLYMIILIILTR